VPGYEAVSMMGMFAPARTPTAVITRLSREVVRVLNTADVKERLSSAGADTVGSTSQEFIAAIKAEMTRWGKVIKEANIKAE
jgi:tripartite-type tricarboxylate transporter receptor subunit TctC